MPADKIHNAEQGIVSNIEMSGEHPGMFHNFSDALSQAVKLR